MVMVTHMDTDTATTDEVGTANGQLSQNLPPMPMLMLMPIMEDITAMVVMALAMAAMVVMALVIMADGTVKDLLMLSPLPMLMPSPLPMLMLMLTHITEDTTDGEVTDSEVTEDTEDTMALVITV